MILFVNDKQEIHDVGSTADKSLSPLYVKDEGNPFATWSVAKICCYKVTVTDGVVTMFTPYIDSSIISHIDQLGRADDTMSEEITIIDDRTAPFTTSVQKQMIPGKVMSMLVTKLKAGTYSIVSDANSLDVTSTNDLLTKSNDTFTLLKDSYVSITATSETEKVCSLLLNKI